MNDSKFAIGQKVYWVCQNESEDKSKLYQQVTSGIIKEMFRTVYKNDDYEYDYTILDDFGNYVYNIKEDIVALNQEDALAKFDNEVNNWLNNKVL